MVNYGIITPKIDNQKQEDFLKFYRIAFEKISERYQHGACNWAQIFLTDTWKTMMAAQQTVLECTDFPDKHPEIGIEEYKQLLKKWYNLNVEIVLAYGKAPESEKIRAEELAL